MSNHLLNKLTQLQVPTMAGSLIRQRETPQAYDELSFEERLTLLITGPTGYGKSWIANALGEQACRQKHSVKYWRAGRRLEMLAQGAVDGAG